MRLMKEIDRKRSKCLKAYNRSLQIFFFRKPWPQWMEGSLCKFYSNKDNLKLFFYAEQVSSIHSLRV
jgi:hypothetical protein